ncbi:MAG: hypothetical protein K6V97_03760 [Actinomycetia bacterium]|nr:hypothetical protein [Actinomycetes bacterium]
MVDADRAAFDSYLQRKRTAWAQAAPRLIQNLPLGQRDSFYWARYITTRGEYGLRAELIRDNAVASARICAVIQRPETNLAVSLGLEALDYADPEVASALGILDRVLRGLCEQPATRDWVLPAFLIGAVATILLFFRRRG